MTHRRKKNIILLLFSQKCFSLEAFICEKRSQKNSQQRKNVTQTTM